MEYRVEEGDPLLRLRCSIIPNLKTGIHNSATNQTINYHLQCIYITHIGG